MMWFIRVRFSMNGPAQQAILNMQNADNDNSETQQQQSAAKKPLSPAARRALKEAEQRRQAAARPDMPEEFGGRGGADPARFGDWEINGRAIDF